MGIQFGRKRSKWTVLLSVHDWLSGHFGMCGIDIPRQQVFDPVDGMVGDAGHHFPQIGFGIQTVEFGRADQAVNDSSSFSARARSCEQIVLPSQGHSAQRALRGVVIDLNVAIFYIACQRGGLHLVGGKLSIESQLGVGTTVRARVPLAGKALIGVAV